jgi:hypothetical protein
MNRKERTRAAYAQIDQAATIHGCDEAGRPLDPRRPKQRELDQRAAEMRARRIFEAKTAQNLPQSLRKSVLDSKNRA